MSKIFDYLSKRFSKKEVPENIQFNDYDETKPRYASETLDGMHTKKFIRLNSEYLSDLIDEMRNNPNCAYKTYFDNLLKEDDYVPEKISAMLKQLYDKDSCYNEILASRICNEMGIPVAYNRYCSLNDKHYILSVDFLGKDCSIVDLNDALFEIKGDSLKYDIYEILSDDNQKSISNMLLEIIEVHKYLCNKLYFKNINFDMHKYVNEFLSQALVRKFITSDTDFYPRNISDIIDGNNNLQMAPVFDNECAFSGSFEVHTVVSDFEYISKHYPEVFEDFWNKYDNLMSDKNFNKLFSKIDDKEYIKKNKKLIKDNYSLMKKCLNIVQSDELNQIN